jgi:adenosine deaminase
MNANKTLTTFIEKMPKVELHVHLEGSVRPSTLLKLARRHDISLPADDIQGLRKWYTFRNFDHFVEIYLTIASCLKTPQDIELIAREFLSEQARQNIQYTEVTFTPYNQYSENGLGFHEQIDAVNRARAWAEKELGVRMGVITDIPRMIPPEEGLRATRWALERFGDGVIALGLGGPEVDNPPEKYDEAFELAAEAGLPRILHAGETVGPKSIWSAIQVADTKRIGHGVRAVEDPELIAYLRETQIPLEVCPTSNLCLGVYPSLEEHSLPTLIENDLYVTLNSDDPPMFNTTLTNEYQICAESYGWDPSFIQELVMNAVNAALLPAEEKQSLREQFQDEFSALP